MDSEITRTIDAFEAAPGRVREAVVGMPEELLQVRSQPGTWSILELVVHLCDSDMIVVDRMKRILTEDHPELLNADEQAYIQRLFPHHQSLEDALTLLEVGRRQFARTLRQLPREAFERTGRHNVAGSVTVSQLVTTYTTHIDHHLRFLVSKKANLIQTAAGEA